MSDDELKAKFDEQAGLSMFAFGIPHILDELARRESERQTAAMVRLTLAIAIMTAVVVAATIVNVIIAFR